MEHSDIADMMQHYAAQAVEIAREFHANLDFSTASCATLDAIVAEVADSMPERVNDDELAEMSKLWGGYLGEVIRRCCGGEWRLERPPGVQAPSAALVVRGARVFPTVKIFRRLTVGGSENVAEFARMVIERLGTAPIQ